METLRQSANNGAIVGTLKSKEYKYGTTKAGDAFISINLVVVNKTEGQIMEQKVELWTKANSKLAKGYNTIIESYKTIDEHGEENADRVKVIGSYEPNEYMKDDELKVFKKFKGLFVNRLDADEADVAGVAIEGVVLNSRPEIKNGTPTGRLLVNFYSVGYNNTIHEFNDLVVEAHLAEDFKKHIPLMSTVVMHIRLDKYVEIEEAKPVQQLFGSSLNGIDNIVKRYVNDDVIVGAVPVDVTKKYSTEQIAEMKKHRELQLNEKKATTFNSPASNVGFGGNVGFGSAMVDDDIPF